MLFVAHDWTKVKLREQGTDTSSGIYSDLVLGFSYYAELVDSLRSAILDDVQVWFSTVASCLNGLRVGISWSDLVVATPTGLVVSTLAESRLYTRTKN